MTRLRKYPEGHCRVCGNTPARTVTQKRKDIITYSYICKGCEGERIEKYLSRVKTLVYDHYGNECACCSESEPMFLSIDHINNDGYLETTASGKNRVGGRWLCSRIIARGYPDTYQILCMNCNFGKKINKGICPHKATNR